MPQLVCIAEGVHTGRLTRGRVYDVTAQDPARALVRIRDNAGRLRWYPSEDFAAPDFVPTRLLSFKLDDPIEDPADDSVEVTVELSDNTRRWLTFSTPTHLARHGDVFVLPGGAEVRAHLDNADVIVVSAISDEAIGAILAYLDSQDRLIAVSQPYGRSLDMEDDSPPSNTT